VVLEEAAGRKVEEEVVAEAFVGPNYVFLNQPMVAQEQEGR